MPASGTSDADLPAREARVAIGRVLKPRGIEGEAFLHPLTDFPERFETLERAVCELPNGRQVKVEVDYVRSYGKRLAIRFQGVRTPEAAAVYGGGLLTVARGELHALPEDTFYVFQIEGLPVVSESGRLLGTVREVLNYPAQDVFVVASEAGDRMVPAVKEWVVVEEERIVVRNAEGLGF